MDTIVSELRTAFQSVMSTIVGLRSVSDTRAQNRMLEDMRVSINRIYGTCDKIVYTKNIDKPFFGLIIVPELPAKKLFDIFVHDTSYIPDSYMMEIDSKLIESGLSDCQIAHIILHDISAMFDSKDGFNKAVSLMDQYLIQTNSVLIKTDSMHYLELIAFGLKDAMFKLTSVFYNKCDTAFDGTEFNFSECIDRLKAEGILPYVMEESPIVVMAWVLRLYNSILDYRISARHTIQKGIKFSGSELLKKELKFLLRRLDRIDDDAIIKESFIDNISEFMKKELHEMKTKGIGSYEDDLYQFQFEINNLETQEEAILLIHQINSRMSVIMDFLSTEELTKSERIRWTKLLDKFNKLRENVSKQKIYQNKTRLYVNYGYDD